MSTSGTIQIRSAGSTAQAHGGTLGALRNRNFRLFQAGQAISQTGTFMQAVAQDWLVLRLTHNSGAALGITTALQFCPLLLCTWGGLLADRYSRRRILMVTQSVMGGLALILGVLALTGTAAIGAVYALAFALGLALAVDRPTRQTFFAEMVGRDGVPNALALTALTTLGSSCEPFHEPFHDPPRASATQRYHAPSELPHSGG
jgi:MFS family permease